MFVDPEKLDKLRRERTLVVIKPEGVVRRLVGDLITRFERKGLKIVAMKMLWPSNKLVEEHYVASEEWLEDMGTRAYNSYVEAGVQPPLSPREIALNVRRKLIEHMTAGPVIAMVLEGAHSIQVLRKMKGATSPLKADVGTIGFDYTLESYELSDLGGWAIKNVIHASDSTLNAEKEIAIWFQKNEIVDYDTAIDAILYSNDWHQHHKQPKQD